jgi:hypothetical protein
MSAVPAKVGEPVQHALSPVREIVPALTTTPVAQVPHVVTTVVPGLLHEAIPPLLTPVLTPILTPVLTPVLSPLVPPLLPPVLSWPPVPAVSGAPAVAPVALLDDGVTRLPRAKADQLLAEQAQAAASTVKTSAATAPPALQGDSPRFGPDALVEPAVHAPVAAAGGSMTVPAPWVPVLPLALGGVAGSTGSQTSSSRSTGDELVGGREARLLAPPPPSRRASFDPRTGMPSSPAFAPGFSPD